ncbi:MAG: LLM class flavin-dependent oxidoreductase [Gammaproteobacteria bacterium]|nr:LLM class flavin-dependent oxidoreductase [Gammaproteobacteria bacterium]
MRFGIFDHMEFRGDSLGQLYEERLKMLEYADDAGFWCYHKAEHHFIHLDAAPSSNVFLAAASQRTSRIRFGPLVYLLPFYEPIRLIEEICALDHLSGGRLEVGVGKGISPAEHMLWGRSPDEARSRFEEVFAIVREGLVNDVLSFDGDFYRIRDATLPMRPLQQPHPAFWYPGNFDYAGRHRLNTIVGGPAERIADQLEQYLGLAADCEENFNPGVAQPTFGATRHFYVAASDEAALARVGAAYPVYHRNLAKLFKQYDVPFPTVDPSFGGDMDAAIAHEGLVAGSPETVARHVAAVRDAGIDYLVGAFAWGDLSHDETMTSIDLFAREVMPQFGPLTAPENQRR